MPLSKYLNGATALVAREPGLDHLADVLALLHRGLRDAGQLVQRHHVADREHLGMAGQRAVGVHRRCARRGRSRRPSARRAARPAARPAPRPPRSGSGRGSSPRRRGPCTVTRSSSMSTARVFSRTSTPIFSSARVGVALQLLVRTGGSTAPAPSSSTIRASRGVDRRGSPAAAPCAPARRSGRPARRRSGPPRPRRRSATRPAPRGSVASSAISNAARIRSRRWRASSTVFMPGRELRRTRRGRSRSASRRPRRPACRRAASTGRPSGPSARTTRASRSMSVHLGEQRARVALLA